MKTLCVRKSQGLHAAFFLVAILLFTRTSHADDYPSRPLKILVSTAPGGNLDLTARLLAKYMQRPLGQSLLVENHSGGDGLIAMHDLLRSEPDGYTVAVVSGGPLIAQAVMRADAGYTFKDFTPIGLVSIAPLVFVVSAKSRFQTLRDFVTYARQHPGELSFGSAGVGGSNHIGFEIFKQMANINVVHIPYRGGGPVIQDLIGGHISIAMEQLTGVSGNIKSGVLRPLAVSVQKRVAALPSVPTVEEIGYPGYNESTWLGLDAPPDLPPAIAARLEAALDNVQKNPEFVKQLSDMGAEPAHLDGAAFGRFLQKQNDEFYAQAGRLGLRHK